MNSRSIVVAIVLGIPAVALLAFGPRGSVNVPEGRIVVRYWEKWTGVEGEVMKRLVERFNAGPGAERNVWVDYNAISAIEQRTLVAAAGGDPPDVAGLYDFIIPQYADQGALRPLDDLVDEFDIDVGAFNPVWIDIGTYNGKLYALPSTPYTIALYYNRALFREAGLDPNHPPQTTAEFEAYARKLTRLGPDGRIVQGAFTPSPAMLGWWPWVWPVFFDAELWDGRTFTLDSPQTRASMEFVTNIRKIDGLDDAAAFDEWFKFEGTAGAIESAQNPFLSGRVAMVYQGPWMSNWIRTYKPDLDYGVAAFPSVTAERRYALASCDVFCVPAGARHPREAMVFIAWLMQQDVMEELCQRHNKISPFRTPGESFYANHPNPHIRTFVELSASADAFSYPDMPMWAQVKDELLQMLNRVLNKPGQIDDAVRRAQAKTSEVVQEYWTMSARRKGGGR